MKIAFVGKGGSGKTTLTALFSKYLEKKGENILAIDADINMNLGNMLGLDTFSKPFLSDKKSEIEIKQFLRGKNDRIFELSHFKKTTPPTRKSNFIFLNDENNKVFENFAIQLGKIKLMTVGSYECESIGASCYHNNLSVFENIVSHTVDINGFLVSDMVAGVDAFANSLHSQFDFLILSVEATQKGVQIYNHYFELAQNAGIAQNLFVIGNKIRDFEDESFLQNKIGKNKILGFINDSKYLRILERDGGVLDINNFENIEALDSIYLLTKDKKTDLNLKLKKLYEVHKKYVQQDYIKARFGDLTSQIDEELDIYEIIEEHEKKK